MLNNIQRIATREFSETSATEEDKECQDIQMMQPTKKRTSAYQQPEEPSSEAPGATTAYLPLLGMVNSDQ